jgi:hypothetical protein
MVGEKKPHEYTASLRVFSETISLAELTEALGSASKGYDRGDLVSRRIPDGKRHQRAGWFLESEARRVKRLEDQIEDLVAFVEERRETFDALAPRVEKDIFCGIFSGQSAQGGFTLEPALLRRLADLGLEVVFDLY